MTDEINEISKERLADYSKKAHAQTKGNQPHDPDKFRKRTNREAGIKTAFNKYHGYKSKVNATEEVEQVDEISNERLKDYSRKAAKEIHTNPSKSFKRGMGVMKSDGIRKSKSWDKDDGKEYKPRKDMRKDRDNKYYHQVHEGKTFSAFMSEIYEEVSKETVSESTERARVSKGAKRVQKLNGYFDRNKNTYHVGGKEIGHRDENGDDHFDVSFMKKHGIPELTNAHMD